MYPDERRVGDDEVSGARPRALRARLLGRLDPAHAPELQPGDRLAAVLVVLVESPEPTLVFAKRSDALPRHPGEISFPGGLVDEEDADLEATALREASEEIGLDPSLPQILGSLPPVHTTVSGILVVPVVGMLEVLPVLHPSDGEIDEVLTFPVRRLSQVESQVEWDRPGGGRWKGWMYEIDGHTIWGATGRMLHDLLWILREEMPSSATEPYGPSDVELRSILGDAKTIAVVGLSSNPLRDSFEVAEYLQGKGYRIVPVNPNETEVLGEKAYPTLLDVPEDVRIDVVDVFRRAELTPPIAAQAVRVGAKVLWLQDGIVNEETRRIAEEAGLTVIMGVCIRRTQRRLEGED